MEIKRKVRVHNFAQSPYILTGGDMSKSYRLESITRTVAPCTCARCQRKHRVVVSFREVQFEIPTDPALPVSLRDGDEVVTVGTKCAYAMLPSVPLPFYGKALLALDQATSH